MVVGIGKTPGGFLLEINVSELHGIAMIFWKNGCHFTLVPSSHSKIMNYEQTCAF